MALLLTTRALDTLSWSVLRALKQRVVGLLGASLLAGLPVHLMLPALPPSALALFVLLSLWLWRLSRRAMASMASRALSLGDTPRARRLYQFLRFTTLDAEGRAACVLSLAACQASVGDYTECLARLEALHTPLHGALLAVSLNLRAYCMARTRSDLQSALRFSEESIALRPQVLGFRHTRGLVMLELGRLDEAARDLDATWRKGDGSDLLEAERCFDLARLWSAKGHEDYASDYLERSMRAAPESRWAPLASSLLGTREQSSVIDALL